MKLTKIQEEILWALKSHPDGLDIEEIRQAIGDHGTQQHLDRRVRTLDPMFIIERSKQGRRTIYTLLGERPEGSWDYEAIPKNLRAKILHRDGQRCRMCGRTVKDDFVKLHVDHMIPRKWGGDTIEENLWSLCSVCNEGKQSYFASFDEGLMASILAIPCVYQRIVTLLKSKFQEWVDSDLIQFVANFNDYQDDWQKRLRELRYTGLEILSRKKKDGKRTKSFYKLDNWVELPTDIRAFVSEYERQRAHQNRKKQKTEADTDDTTPPLE